jgi:hypothetical protein
MGFKVTVHKNGAKHGEAHYTSEAVAVGMAKKMKNAGADVSVARCNGACCCGTKSNPRRARGGSSAALEQKIAALEATLPKATVRAALEECGWSGPMMMASRSEMETYLRELRRHAKANPRRNVKSAKEEAKFWRQIKRAEAEEFVTKVPRRNGTTAGEMAAGRSMAYTRLFRNGAAKSETYEQARKRIFAEFGAAGWTTSSPSLKVPHATSPDGLTRAWFKPQAIHFTNVGPHQRHELGNAHTVSYSLDIRKVPAGVFVPWFTKNFAK